VILNGMIDIGGLSFSHADAMANADAAFRDIEARAVQGMLFSLRYFPSAASAEISQQPTLGASTTESETSLFSGEPSVVGGLLSLPSSAPTFPSSTTSIPSSPPSALSIPSPSLPGPPPSLTSSSPTPPSTTVSAPVSMPSAPNSPSSSPASATSSPNGYAAASSSLDSDGRQSAQHTTEGGMVSLIRQPVAQASTVDKISVAAIDALLEIPAKVDGMQGRFQAFEISVISETPRRVVPLPAGVQINLPFDSANEKTTPVTDPNLHGAWIPSTFAGTISRAWVCEHCSWAS